MITHVQSSTERCSSSLNHAHSLSRTLILFLSGTLLFASAILSGCAGVTSAKGTSVSADSTNVAPATSASASASPASMAFGNVSIGSSGNQSLTITDSGTAALTISQASASGAGFSVSGVTLPVTLNPGSSATFTATFAPTASGTVSGTASFTSSQLSSAFTVSMTGTGVAVAPSISTQPLSQSILSGQTATFSVTARGTAPLSYQWKLNGSNITGATSSAYTTPTETTANNGAQFAVAVSNAAGSILSNVATLTVTTTPVAPSITTQPSSQTIFAGQTATFSVIANGTSPLSYQWSMNGTAITGATSSSYTTPTETTSNSGEVFSVVVTNSVNHATSNNATLTVNPDPIAPSITSQPASQTIIAGQTATFSVTASGTAPLTYQWKMNGTSINGATSASYTTPAETTANNGAQFAVTVSNSAGNATSNTAILTVNPAPVAPSITTQPASVTISSGQTATFSVVATGTAPLSYQWYMNGTAITGATSSSYSTPTETSSNSGEVFDVVVSNSVGNTPSNNATLTVSSHSATVNWSASSSSGVTGYNVFRGTVQGTYTQVNTSPVTALTYTDNSVAASTTYYYVLTAIGSGGVQSDYSAVGTAVIP